jgi:hypothetical protein
VGVCVPGGDDDAILQRRRSGNAGNCGERSGRDREGEDLARGPRFQPATATCSRRRWAASNQTRSVCTTCTGMCASGARTCTMRSTTGSRRETIRRDLQRPQTGCVGMAAGTPAQRSAGRRAAGGASPQAGTSTWAFVSPWFRPASEPTRLAGRHAHHHLLASHRPHVEAQDVDAAKAILRACLPSVECGRRRGSVRAPSVRRQPGVMTPASGCFRRQTGVSLCVRRPRETADKLLIFRENGHYR